MRSVIQPPRPAAALPARVQSRGLASRRRRGGAILAAAFAAAVFGGCAALEGALQLQAPRFSVLPDRPAELRLLGPSMDRPLGGASIRLWARVQNPNAVGFTLTRFTGNLQLEGTRTAALEFPLGVPLTASADTIVPFDLALSFSDMPALAEVVTRALGRNSVGYSLDGTFAVDAGMLGQPSFGPATWLAGEMRVFR
jgi:hypothetical protein